ncbi:hypothetical protein SAMN05216518_10518 [Bacteroidales bacterium KHT7]|nr:hypothetical protein SAMN05216518_10518 [Bacteroidales bacterium KHT7]
MRLVWKLLRQHISVPQFVGFLFANLFGMVIVLVGFQFYSDVVPLFQQGDSFMREDYLIVSKKISTFGSVMGKTNTFSASDIDEIKEQPFTSQIGAFTPSAFKVSASMGLEGAEGFTTEMFFESVPDHFVDVSLDDWTFSEGDKEIPIIIPRNYLNMYNFGFAQSRSLPKVSEGLMGMIHFDISIRGNGKSDMYKGRIIGFSSRLNTILVPEKFMKWANSYYSADAGVDNEPSRMILEVKNPADENIAKFFQSKDYETEDNKLDAGKTTWFLRMMVGIVMIIGLLISALSFYILMLSIYLLVEKNASKLENLLLIGYSPVKVALPYQALTILLNVAVLVVAVIVVALVRSYYMDVVTMLYPQIETGTLFPAIGLGLLLFVVVSLLNIVVVKGKVMQIWQRKD